MRAHCPAGQKREQLDNRTSCKHIDSLSGLATTSTDKISMVGQR